jgi:hypothetical protein
MDRDYSPAEIIRHLLVDLSLGALTGQDWPISIAIAQPLPDAAIILYDTAGKLDGRIMATGEIVTHPGIQIRVRGPAYPIAWGKAKAISDRLSAVYHSEVAVASDKAYTVISITQEGDIMPLGLVTEGDRTNHNFTVNITTTIEEQ